MSQAEQERSQEQREAFEAEIEQVQQFGAVFVLAGVFFTEPSGSALATVVGWITVYLSWLYMLKTSFFTPSSAWPSRPSATAGA